jgi:hypothetical protein
MERRNALALAVAAGGTILASGVAFAANVGLLQDDADPVGQLETTNVGALLTGDATTSTTPSTIVIDVPLPALPGTETTLPAGAVDGSSDDDDFDDDFDDEFDDEFDDDDFDIDDDESDDDSSDSSGHGSDDDHDDEDDDDD